MAGRQGDAGDYGQDRGVGWLLFASTMLGLAGIMSCIDGIMALSKSRAGFFNPAAYYTFSDLRTWGWITLIIGVLLIIAAGGALRGGQFGRWFGILAASLSLIGQFSFMQAYPFWTLLFFAVDIIVIYGLAVYGGQGDTT